MAIPVNQTTTHPDDFGAACVSVPLADLRAIIEELASADTPAIAFSGDHTTNLERAYDERGEIARRAAGALERYLPTC